MTVTSYHITVTRSDSLKRGAGAARKAGRRSDSPNLYRSRSRPPARPSVRPSACRLCRNKTICSRSVQVERSRW